MPRKNIIKTYVKDGYYHVYNRGVEKRIIYKDEKDYKVFLSYLKEALSPPPKRNKLKTPFTLQGLIFKGVPRQPKNFNKEIDLLAFCLMPNHFHLLIKQKTKSSMEKFVKTVLTRYTMYFNKRHDRVGGLFQGPYKAVLITKDDYLLYLSKYIHLNPLEIGMTLEDAYSSYSSFTGLTKNSWIKPNFILNYFSNKYKSNKQKYTSYKQFVERKNDSLQLDENVVFDL